MSGSQFILAADIGGTHATFALAEITNEGPRIITEDSLASREFQNFAPLLQQFLDRPDVKPAREHIAASCFAVAGPVKDNAAVLTNLGWQVEGEAVSEQFQLPKVTLINDFQAAGLSVNYLPTASFTTLQAAEADDEAPSIIVGAGTGFIAFLLSFVGSTTIIALSWLWYRPLLGIALLTLALGGLFLIKKAFQPKTA